jgi:hypothetical protein
MSYCRLLLDGSDVYMYPTGSTPSIQEPIVCQWCKLQPSGDYLAHSHQSALEHLIEHRHAGHNVPDEALIRLRREANADRACPGCGKTFTRPDWDPRCSSCAESGTGVNLGASPIVVEHASLKKTSEDSDYRVVCPKCDQGTLLVRRNQITLRIQRGDMCTLCGQRFVYTDAAIGGEPVGL